MTKALEIISGYSKMRKEDSAPRQGRENADDHVCIRKSLAETTKKLIDWVKNADIYIDYPVI